MFYAYKVKLDTEKYSDIVSKGPLCVKLTLVYRLISQKCPDIKMVLY